MPGSAVSDLAGRVLAGRYLLHGAIGTGASGRVYAADDTRLRRRVAVKVLHPALAEDGAFLRRFRAEAQLAASLHHPHIVTVHDWGEDDVPFMVLELLEGGSLRAMLDQGELLTVAQAARVGRDVASALEYAHARSVLHRDIKPANLLFDEHGIVRVADFGLARALAEASWTEPAGAVFGTARYASPEQARGVQLDARSDLYSLGLVLVEAVTGTVPFASDTTLGTLTARTLESLAAPEALGILGPVIDRAGALDVADRYPDAATMRQAISDAADALPPPGPLVLAGMADRVDLHPTRAVPAPTAPLFDQDAIEVVTSPPVTPAVEATFILEPDPPRRGAAAAKPRPKGQRRLVPFVVAFVVILIMSLAAVALAQVRGGKLIPIPGYVGSSLADARAAARRAGIQVDVLPAQTAPDPAGNVIRQSPDPGTFTNNHHVTLTVSAGPSKVLVPNVLGKPYPAATAELDSAGLRYGATPKQVYNSASAGTVLVIAPGPGQLEPPDTSIFIEVSKGRAPVVPTDVTKNMTFAAAQAALESKHFAVQRGPDVFDSTVPKGDVVSMQPGASAPAPYGSTITLVVSKGPEMIDVPNVVNLTLTEATGLLTQDGFQIATNGTFTSGSRSVGQSPSAHTKAAKGSTVTVSF